MNWTRTIAGLVLAFGFAGAPTQAQEADHLQCYKIADGLKLTGTLDLESPQLGLAPGCRISAAKLFCVSATARNVAATDKATGEPITPAPVSGPDPGDRICYKLKCPAASIPDQQATDPFGTRTVRKPRAAMLCTPAIAGGPTTTSSTTSTTSTTTTTTLRFVDNGDGTVMDNATGLQWEQKTLDGSVHDLFNLYTWAAPGGRGGERDPSGTAYTAFLGSLNLCVSVDGSAVEAFTGHCDWRLPTVAELQTILLSPCATNPCVDPVFGPVSDRSYWTSTTFAGSFGSAWVVNLGDGRIDPSPKTSTAAAIAVRGGGL